MQIIDYFRDDRPARWLEQIAGYEWRAAKFLAQLLGEGSFHATLGSGTLYLLVEGDSLVSFLTLAQRDCIDAPECAPWIGFVHTAPEYRGRRHVGRLIDHACAVAREHGAAQVYICTDHVGLYEKYGFTYLENRVSIYGEDSRVYVREV
ncbi:MAG: GNAT family N-acetyltransferase [Clostridia bacterium]|nr:GNAT family N-acetyltransferase [Clostridia bacterium]